MSKLSKQWKKVACSGKAAALYNQLQNRRELDVLYHVDFGNLQVVIVGIEFVQSGPVTKSHKAIHKALNKSCLTDSQIPQVADFTPWASQGVLMLNIDAANTEPDKSIDNTTDKKESPTMKQYWHCFLSRLSVAKPDLYFLLWGKAAAEVAPKLKSSNGRVMKWGHPFSFTRKTEKDSFVFCDHFAKLQKSGLKINWAFGREKRNETLDIFKDGIVVFTDGSCEPNKRCPEAVGGYAALIIHPESESKKSESILFGRIDSTKEFATNIRAEGFAILKALEHIADLDPGSWERFTLISDCEFWINMIYTYMPKWSASKFETQSNPDITVKIWALWSKLAFTAKLNREQIEKAKLTHLYSVDGGNEKKMLRENKIVHVRSHNKSGWKNMPEGSYEYTLYLYNDAVDKKASFVK